MKKHSSAKSCVLAIATAMTTMSLVSYGGQNTQNQAESTETAKTVMGTNGTSADYYMYDGDQWIEWTSCQAEKKVDGQWQADNVRRAISILDIAKLLGN